MLVMPLRAKLCKQIRHGGFLLPTKHLLFQSATELSVLPRHCHIATFSARLSLNVPPRLICFQPSSNFTKPSKLELARCNSSSTVSRSFADPSRPDLFYHLVDPPTPLSRTAPAFALSFLHTPPSSGMSRTIVGWLPAVAEGDAEGAGLNDFKENPAFRSLLHEAIKTGLRDGLDDIQANGAIQLQQGWMHIHDNRNIPALGRIGDPDDILGSVLVEDGKILPDTYQAMPSYRVCTSDGLTQLTEGLHQKLRALLLVQDCAERVS